MKNQQIWNALNVGRVIFHHDTTRKSFFQLLDQICLELIFQHNGVSFQFSKNSKEDVVFNKNAYLSSLFIKGHVFFARKKEHKKKTETRLSIYVQICSCQLLFLKYRISIQINHKPPVHNVRITSRINPAVLRFFFPPLLIYRFSFLSFYSFSIFLKYLS